MQEHRNKRVIKKIPYLRTENLKTAARAYLAHIWEYPLPGSYCMEHKCFFLSDFSGTFTAKHFILNK